MHATWHGQTLAESDATVVVEGNHYFPKDSVRPGVLAPGDRAYTCPWKGDATYYDVVTGDAVKKNAAWSYDDPKPAAQNIRGHVAFDPEIDVGK